MYQVGHIIFFVLLFLNGFRFFYVFVEICIFAVGLYAYLINYLLGGFLLIQIGGLSCLHAKFEQVLWKDIFLLMLSDLF